MEDKNKMVLEFEKYVNEQKDNILREISKVYGVYDFLLGDSSLVIDPQTLDKITDITEDFFKAIREEVS